MGDSFLSKFNNIVIKNSGNLSKSNIQEIVHNRRVPVGTINMMKLSDIDLQRPVKPPMPNSNMKKSIIVAAKGDEEEPLSKE